MAPDFVVCRAGHYRIDRIIPDLESGRQIRQLGGHEKSVFTLSLRARLEIQAEPVFALASLRMRRKARASCSHASEDSIVASKSFDSRRARLIQPSVLSTTHLFGKTMKPVTCLSVRL